MFSKNSVSIWILDGLITLFSMSLECFPMVDAPASASFYDLIFGPNYRVDLTFMEIFNEPLNFFLSTFFRLFFIFTTDDAFLLAFY